MLHGSRLEVAPQVVGYPMCPLRPDPQAAPSSYQPFGFGWGEALGGSAQVPSVSNVFLPQTTNLMRPNVQGLCGGEPSVGDWLSWSASAIGSTGTDPPGALFKTEEAISGPSDALIPGQFGIMGVKGISSASQSGDETVPLVSCKGPDDESNDSEEANLRQMLLMEMADKRDRKDKHSTTAEVATQCSQNYCVMLIISAGKALLVVKL